MKTLHKNALDNLDKNDIVDPQFRWEYPKYEIRKFSIHFLKDSARNKNIERTNLENKLKLLKLDEILLITLNILKLMKSLIRSTKKKQMVLEVEM